MSEPKTTKTKRMHKRIDRVRGVPNRSSRLLRGRSKTDIKKEVAMGAIMKPPTYKSTPKRKIKSRAAVARYSGSDAEGAVILSVFVNWLNE
jgi:hypothetical protein